MKLFELTLFDEVFITEKIKSACNLNIRLFKLQDVPEARRLHFLSKLSLPALLLLLFKSIRLKFLSSLLLTVSLNINRLSHINLLLTLFTIIFEHLSVLIVSSYKYHTHHLSYTIRMKPKHKMCHV